MLVLLMVAVATLGGRDELNRGGGHLHPRGAERGEPDGDSRPAG